MSFVGLLIEVDHVAGLLRRLRARVHRDGDVGLRERGRVVRAVAAHRDEPAFALMPANQLELRLGRRFREELVDAGLGGDRRGREPVVARDHDGLDAHLPQLGEALADAAFDDVAQLDDAEHARAFAALGDDERRRAVARDLVDDLADGGAATCRPRSRRTAGSRRRRPCAACGLRRRRRSCASSPRTCGRCAAAKRRRGRAARIAASRARRSSGPPASRRRATRAGRRRRARAPRRAARDGIPSLAGRRA